MYHYIHSSTIYNIEDMETTQLSINRWIDNEDVILFLFICIYVHIFIHTVGYYSVMKNEMVPFQQRGWT